MMDGDAVGINVDGEVDQFSLEETGTTWPSTGGQMGIPSARFSSTGGRAIVTVNDPDEPLILRYEGNHPDGYGDWTLEAVTR